MNKNLLAALIGIALIGCIVLWHSSSYKGDKHPLVKSDTSLTWARYFNSVGAKTTDTSSEAIRVVKDTSRFDSVDRDWLKNVKDTAYFVPIDTTVNIPNKVDTLAKQTDTSYQKTWHGKRKLHIYVPIDKNWIIQDYNKIIVLGTK